MSLRLLSGEDYRFLAALPENERRTVVALIRELDARFVDHDDQGESLNACFFGELEERRP